MIDLHRLATELEIELAHPSQKLLLARPQATPVSSYDRELHDQAVSSGRDTCQRLLERSLPHQKPAPHVIDEARR